MTPADNVLWNLTKVVPLLCAVVLAGALTAFSSAAAAQPDSEGSETADAEADDGESEADADEGEEEGGAEPASDAEVALAATAVNPGYPVHGFVATPYRLRLRKDGADKDQDLASLVAMDFGDRTRNTVTVHAMGRLSWDIDANQETVGYYPFDNVSDEAGPVEGRLYYGHVDMNRVGPFEILRLGRQAIYDTPEFAFFDGLRLESKRFTGLDLKLGAYGGRTAHILGEWDAMDITGGGFAQVAPWEGARLRTDALVLVDDSFAGETNNNLLGLSMWQILGEHLELYGRVTAVDVEPRDATARASLSDDELALTADLTYFVLIKPREEVALPLDAFSAQLLHFSPYHEVRTTVAKGWGDHVVTELGYQGRQVTDSDDEGVYNHSFHRVFFTPSVHDLGTKGLSLALSGEFWTGEEQREIGGGADVGYRYQKAVRTSFGTSYALYKFDLLLNDEEEVDVQTYYVRLDVEVLDGLRADARYEFETHGSESEGSDQFQTVRVGLLWRF